MTLAKFFLFFCGVVKTQENVSQRLAIAFSGRKNGIIAAFCVFHSVHDKEKPSRLICECDTDPEQFLCSGKADNPSLALELFAAKRSWCAPLVRVGLRDPGAQLTPPELGWARGDLPSEAACEGSVWA